MLIVIQTALLNGDVIACSKMSSGAELIILHCVMCSDRLDDLFVHCVFWERDIGMDI